MKNRNTPLAIAALLGMSLIGGAAYWLSLPPRSTLEVNRVENAPADPEPQVLDPIEVPKRPDPQWKIVKDPRKDIPTLGKIFALKNEALPNGWVGELAANVDLEDLMKLFLPRAKGGLGFGPMPTPGKPDGIEMVIQGLEKNGPADLNPEALTTSAFQTLAIARIVAQKNPSRLTPAQRKAWRKAASDFVSAANRFAQATEANAPKDIQQAARKVNNACIACHNDYKGGIDLQDEREPTPVLLARAGTGARDRRLGAIRSLGYRRKEADAVIPGLIDVLQDEQHFIHKEALDSLNALGQKTTTNHAALDAALKTESDFLRFYFARQVAPAKSPLEGLTAALQSPKEPVRVKAAELIPLLGAEAKGASAALTRLQANDPDADVRLAASRALQKINNEGNQAVLLRELKDADPIIRGRAALALARLGKPAVPDLRGLLKEDNRDVRASAIGALGRIGPDAKEAVPELVELVKGEDKLLQKLAGDALRKIDKEAADAAGVK